MATFAVVPSHSEGLPMVVLEFWAASKAVLMTAACNLPIGFRRGAVIEIETAVPRLVEGLVHWTPMSGPPCVPEQSTL
jgi:hypothetical protein